MARQEGGVHAPITLQPVSIETSSEDRDARLVFSDGHLIGVLVHLTDPVHDSRRGMWFLEIGFGRYSSPNAPTFADLDEAQLWFGRKRAN